MTSAPCPVFATRPCLVTECTKLKYQLSTSSSQLAETERQCRHLQQRDADLQESLKAKVMYRLRCSGLVRCQGVGGGAG